MQLTTVLSRIRVVLFKETVAKAVESKEGTDDLVRRLPRSFLKEAVLGQGLEGGQGAKSIMPAEGKV